MKHTAIVIPSLEPDEKLLNLLKDIRKEETETPILLVNDGSASSYDQIFAQAKADYDCLLLKHEVNKGKGAALKTAIRYILEALPGIDFMITIDSDGQHKYKDMVKCVSKAQDNPKALILGTRAFDQDVPLRSKFGNILTRNILRLTTGIAVGDTQTGLRVIPRSFMPQLLETEGERFEYETNMLIEAKDSKIPILTQTIDTVYIEENESSHFRVIADSLSIYAIFFKYILSSLICFLVDIALFHVFDHLLSSVSLLWATMSATVMARVLSSFLNYYLNRQHVFSSGSSSSIVKYFSLVIAQLLASGLLVSLFRFLLPSVQPAVIIKVVVDCLLFCLSYQIQKKYVF